MKQADRSGRTGAMGTRIAFGLSMVANIAVVGLRASHTVEGPGAYALYLTAGLYFVAVLAYVFGGWNAVFLSMLAATTAVFFGAIHVIAYRAPVEASMGVVQKIFYFHAPAAYSMYLGAAACFVGSAGYLYAG